MSVLLATAAATALSGTTFQCEVDTAYFTLFAPAEEVTANHRGNILTLYKIEGDGELLPAPVRITQIFDDLPSELYVELSAGGMMFEYTISDLDNAANTASVAITGEVAPDEKVTLTGACTYTRKDTQAMEGTAQ